MIWLQYWLCFTSQDLYPTGDDGLAMLCSTCVCGYRTAILFTDALHAVLDPHGEIHQAPEMVQLSVVLVSDAHGFTICDCDIFVAGPKDTIVVRILLFTWPCLVIGPQYSVLWQLMEARRENHPLSGDKGWGTAWAPQNRRSGRRWFFLLTLGLWVGPVEIFFGCLFLIVCRWHKGIEKPTYKILCNISSPPVGTIWDCGSRGSILFWFLGLGLDLFLLIKNYNSN